jgi:hypothetical protein
LDCWLINPSPIISVFVRRWRNQAAASAPADFRFLCQARGL